MIYVDNAVSQSVIHILFSVADISCQFPGSRLGGPGGGGGEELLVARLRKPPGFKGHPLFADDRRIDTFQLVLRGRLC